MEDIEKKCESLKKAITGIENECFDYKQLAEKNHGMSYVIKENGLKCISNVKITWELLMSSYRYARKKRTSNLN